jgi:hypothetical protein
MTGNNIIDFLRLVAARADVLDALKVKSKDEVIAAAADFGFPFAEAEWDGLIWDLEVHLAAKRGEAFDNRFPLWQSLWGKYYFEFLATVLIPSFTDDDFATVLAARAAARPPA